MRFPKIAAPSCVSPGGILLPRVSQGGCVSPGGISLPRIEVDSCILAPTVPGEQGGGGGGGGTPPGPDWPSFAYGVAVCLHCQGVGLNGTPNDIGGFSSTSPWTATVPPSANFDLLTEMLGGSFFEYTTNTAGFVSGSYTGPACNCRLTLTVTMTGTFGSSGSPNFIAVFQNGGSPLSPGAGPVLGLGGIAGASASIVAGTNQYDFSLPASTANEIRVYIQGTADASSRIHIIGQFSNV